MAIPQELQGVLAADAHTLSGAVRFQGTRVFASQLFDYVLCGQSVEQFLEDFEGVTREQVQAVLDWKHREIDADLTKMSAA